MEIEFDISEETSCKVSFAKRNITIYSPERLKGDDITTMVEKLNTVASLDPLEVADFEIIHKPNKN